MLMGLGATYHCWNPQLEDLLRRKTPGSPPKARVLLIDNRGVGKTDSPRSKHAYTTTVMAGDVTSLLDHLGWGRVHLVGHSMGSMIAAKVAAQAPHRIRSLCLISPTGGGWQIVPRTFASLKIVLQLFFARTAKQRTWCDLRLHFSRKMLSSLDEKYGRTREELLYEQYMEGAEGGGPGQSNHGFWGQLYAVWSHKLTEKEAQLLRESKLPVMVIHGRYDILASPVYGERIAQRLEAPCIMLDGAHMICRERGPEVNLLLHHHIFHGRRLKDTQHKFLTDDPEPMLPLPGAATSPASSKGSSELHSCSEGQTCEDNSGEESPQTSPEKQQAYA